MVEVTETALIRFATFWFYDNMLQKCSSCARVSTVGETGTSERFDEVGTRIDQRFDEMNRRLEQVAERLDKLGDELESLQRMLLFGSLTISFAFIAASLAFSAQA